MSKTIRSIIEIVILLVCSMQMHAQIDESNVINTYYISSSQGNNANDGLTEKTPLHDISALPSKKNSRVRLLSGDIFFERVSGLDNCILESYGEGERPLICGFKILTNPGAWKYSKDGNWFIDLSIEENFTGYLANKAVDKNSANNIGLIYDARKDKVYGHLVQFKSEMKSDGDFYMTELYKPADIKKNPFDTLYFKISKNPQSLGCLCFSMNGVGISRISNSIIRNVAVAGFSCHGINSCKNTKIVNCSIDLVGGAIFIKDRWWSRYGNGIEFWSDCSDNYVTNCIISRTFDCATTIQGNSTSKVVVKNIHFIGNRMYHCRQAFEHFLNDQGQDFGSAYENCSFERNVAYEMGYNEFSSPEPRDCNILSYETKRKSIDICDNIFFGGNHMYGSWMNSGKQKNKVYLYSDQYLFHTHWKAGFKPLLSGNSSSNQAFVDLTADNTEFIVVNRSSLKTRLIKRRILKQVNWKPVGALRKYIQRGCSFGK